MSPQKLAATLLLSFSPLLVKAQVEIHSHALTGGGGSSSGGDYTITGVIAQPIVGFASGSSYEIKSGFSASLEIIPSAPSGSFQTWIDSLTGNNRPPAGQRGPEDSPAGDGMSNLLKYVLGLMPMVPSADAVPKVIVVSLNDGGVEKDFLGIEFIRASNAVAEVDVENSQDLIAWQPIAFTENVMSTGDENRELIQLITNIEVEEETTEFLRLRITAL